MDEGSHNRLCAFTKTKNSISLDSRFVDLENTGFPATLSIVCVHLGQRKLSVIRSSRVSAIQGLLSIEVNGGTVGTFRIVRYILGVRC